MQHFQCRTEVVFARGALARLEACAARSAFLITDGFFEKNGQAEAVGRRVRGAALTVWARVQPDPTVELVAQALAAFEAAESDLLIALGGGSAIDCAKAVLHLCAKRPYFVAVPTTCGTGSEVTSFSIVTVNGVKTPIVDAALAPDLAILDASLLDGLPIAIVADSGMDCLSHALEALVAKKRSAFSHALAMQSFCMGYDGLVRGDRDVLQVAACMAGLAFDVAGLGICHSLAHALGGRYHLPHGRLNAMLMPAVMTFNAPQSDGLYVELAKRCGLGGSTQMLTLRNFSVALTRLRASLGMPANLKEAGVSQSETQTLAQSALADPCTATNPRAPSERDLQQILEQIQG